MVVYAAQEPCFGTIELVPVSVQVFGLTTTCPSDMITKKVIPNIQTCRLACYWQWGYLHLTAQDHLAAIYMLDHAGAFIAPCAVRDLR